MKLLYTAFAALLFHATATATTWPVTVSNFQFSPSTVNAVVGDVVEFTWTSGTHTTTCGPALPGTSLPAGATPWDAPITTTNKTFSYTLTVAGTYNYGCIPHFDLGMVGTIVVSGVLPVKMGNFTVAATKTAALLQWETFSESNAGYFSIRKSTDGAHFTEIGKVNATGNSDRKIAYSFRDNELGSVFKYVYYEIVIVDIDRKESFSPIKTVRNAAVTREDLIVALSPNPVTRPGQLQLKFNADRKGEMSVSIYNSSGQQVLRTTMAAFYGLNSGHLHVCDLQKGTYNVIFELEGKREIRKVAIL